MLRFYLDEHVPAAVGMEFAELFFISELQPQRNFTVSLDRHLKQV